MLAQFTWIWSFDGWIVLAGILCAMSCALLGNFMVLRKMSMMGDAISHAVLPGLAAAFLISGSRDSFVMLAGAAVVGVLTAVLTQGIAHLGKVDEGASMGVVFTALFAVGLILIRQAADKVDLDPSCVLYGVIESVPAYMVSLGGWHVPRVVLVLGVMLVANSLFVGLFYKELKISSFDPALATTLGINSTLMHYLLMTMVAATTVASFEAVGSILVVAMLIVPAAAAHLLTDRLGPMILVSLVIAALSAIFGHLGAITVPSWFGYASTTTSGMMAATAGFIFLLVMLGAPRHGVISKLVHRAALSLRIIGEDVLGMLYRVEEQQAGAGLSFDRLRGSLLAGRAPLSVALVYLGRRGKLRSDSTGYHLTDLGRERARDLLRAHRLWETYLVQDADVQVDKTHRSAERLEHVTSPELRAKLGASVQHDHDPQGKPIPPA